MTYHAKMDDRRRAGRGTDFPVGICCRCEDRRSCGYQDGARGQSRGEIRTATAFYQFRNTGNEALHKQALLPLPFHRPYLAARAATGRPQGLAFASEQVRAAVPDLSVEFRKMVVADDYVTVHMDLKGHVTGAFGKIKGRGQAIDFIATDLLRITDGRVTDTWHIEDNLTLQTEIGVFHLDRSQ